VSGPEVRCLPVAGDSLSRVRPLGPSLVSGVWYVVVS